MSNREETYAPIITPEVANLLAFLLQMAKPQKVLEIGTAIGYSAVFMAGHLPPGGKIVTLERYEKMVRLAKQNIEKARLNHVITILEGEACDSLLALEKGGEAFDFIFLDGAKAQYLNFLPHLLALLKPGGMLVSDNVLYQGMIASNELVVRRKITIVKRLRKYLQAISNHPQLATTVLPIGDGVAVSYLKNKIDEVRDGTGKS